MLAFCHFSHNNEMLLRPFCQLSDGTVRPFCQLSDETERPFCQLSDGTERPFCQLSDGTVRPFCQLSDGTVRPFCQLSDGTVISHLACKNFHSDTIMSYIMPSSRKCSSLRQDKTSNATVGFNIPLNTL